MWIAIKRRQLLQLQQASPTSSTAPYFSWTSAASANHSSCVRQSRSTPVYTTVALLNPARLFWPARREDEAAGCAAQPTRTIVFSTFVKALDLLERRLEGTGIGVVRLDGGIKTIEGRSQAVRQFARDPQVWARTIPLQG